jgi:molybdate transport system regulatory protein
MHTMRYDAGATTGLLAMRTRSRLAQTGFYGGAAPLDEGSGFAVFWRSPFPAPRTMPDTRLSIRLDLTSGDRIGPGKIALLEAIQATGSISAAARKIGMSYRRAWLLVEQINDSLQEPAVTAATGGRQGGGAALTASGERVIALYRSIENIARSSAKEEFRAVGKLVRKRRAARA